MRRGFGILFMLMGSILLLGAGFLILNNRQEERQAQMFAQDVLPVIREQIRQSDRTSPMETAATAEPETYIPMEYLAPEDLVMTEKTINGYAYIGYLSVPELDLELPVMSGWTSRQLQIAPCRYTGTLRGGDLVIMAHNYNTHFGRLSQLAEGAQIRFVDMDGKTWDYTVEAMDVLAADAVEEMTAGEYDLTLFTCAANRTHRVTVRCDLKDQ